ELQCARAGNAPIVVTKVTGKVYETGTAKPLSEYLAAISDAEQIRDGMKWMRAGIPHMPIVDVARFLGAGRLAGATPLIHAHLDVQRHRPLLRGTSGRTAEGLLPAGTSVDGQPDCR